MPSAHLYMNDFGATILTRKNVISQNTKYVDVQCLHPICGPCVFLLNVDILISVSESVFTMTYFFNFNITSFCATNTCSYFGLEYC